MSLIVILINDIHRGDEFNLYVNVREIRTSSLCKESDGNEMIINGLFLFVFGRPGKDGKTMLKCNRVDP